MKHLVICPVLVLFASYRGQCVNNGKGHNIFATTKLQVRDGISAQKKLLHPFSLDYCKSVSGILSVPNRAVRRILVTKNTKSFYWIFWITHGMAWFEIGYDLFVATFNAK